MADSTPPNTITPEDHLPELQKAVGQHVMSIVQDSNGIIWLGTEGNGVFRYDEKASSDHCITQYAQAAGLPDSCIYALCIDKSGRIWAGHLNHGVSIYNGTSWKNYDVLDGPIGERIYAMNCCLKDGSVWMATNGGLSRYIPHTNSWQHFTMADGLPENVATCITSDPSTGDVLVGFKTTGLAVARFADGYSVWHRSSCSVNLTDTGRGDGLAGGMINDVHICRSGVYYAATTSGLCYSSDTGDHWHYLRGNDWVNKVRQSALHLEPVKVEDGLMLLPEDYIASLAELQDGDLALGFWSKGACSWDYQTRQPDPIDIPKINNLSSDYVYRLSVLNDGRLMSSIYGAGVYIPPPTPYVPKGGSTPETMPVDFPKPLATPSDNDIATLSDGIKRALAIKVDKVLDAVLLSEDWRTEGKYLGRYGRYWTCLCAFLSPHDYLWGCGDEPVIYRATMR